MWLGIINVVVTSMSVGIDESLHKVPLLHYTVLENTLPLIICSRDITFGWIVGQ